MNVEEGRYDSRRSGRPLAWDIVLDLHAGTMVVGSHGSPIGHCILMSQMDNAGIVESSKPGQSHAVLAMHDFGIANTIEAEYKKPHRRHEYKSSMNVKSPIK